MFWLEAAARTLASHRRDLDDLRANDELTQPFAMIESKPRAMVIQWTSRSCLRSPQNLFVHRLQLSPTGIDRAL